jgi:hypothetical protein
MRGIPGLHVFCPANENELVDALPSVLAHPAPCYVRFVGGAGTDATRSPFRYGKGVESFATGTTSRSSHTGCWSLESLDAASLLREVGIGCSVVHLRMLSKPLDEALVLDVALRVRHVVVVEDHFASSGMGSVVAEPPREEQCRPPGHAHRVRRGMARSGSARGRARARGVLSEAPRGAHRARFCGGRTLMSTRTRALPSIERSDALYARAERLIPAGTQTLAKGPSQHVRGVMPKYLVRGDGCRVVCADGQSFTDYTMGVGPLVLGYRHPEVDEAIVAQLRDGIVFSLMHPLEVEVAEAIHAVVPRAERIRFSKTGADVTSAAVRLSRAFTGRDLVLTCGYHGWHDFYVSVTDRHRGRAERGPGSLVHDPVQRHRGRARLHR